MKCQIFQTFSLIANFCPKVDVLCILAWVSLGSNRHFHKAASFDRDVSSPLRKLQAKLNSAQSEHLHSTKFLANILLSLTALLWGWELSPLLTLTWIHVSLLHVTYWCTLHPHALNAQGRQSCSRTWRRVELLWEALPPALTWHGAFLHLLTFYGTPSSWN